MLGVGCWVLDVACRVFIAAPIIACAAPGLSPRHLQTEMADRLVIFLHLPKAAGSTLTRVIGQQYRPEEIRNLGGIARTVALQEAAHLTRPPARIRIITGHVPFGIHRAVHGDFTYIT